MRHAKAIGRLGGLAAGLGIGAALAVSPGIAAAAPDTDFFVDPMPAGTTPAALDIDVSFNGMDVFHTDHHTALASSGANDFAIAIGTDSRAEAGAGDFPGQFDTAFANGPSAFAISGLGNADSAYANGSGAIAEAEGVGTNLSYGNFASAFGDHTQAQALPFSLTTPSGFDTAQVYDPFGSGVSQAEAGGGFFNVADVFGDNSAATAGFGGDFDFGEVLGNGLTSSSATGGSFITDILTPFLDFHF